VAFTVDLGAGVFRSVLLTQSSGKFLYVQTQAGLLIYSMDAVSGALTPLSEPVTTLTFAKGTVVADPMEPYIYSLRRTGAGDAASCGQRRRKSARRIYLAAFGAGGSMPALHIVTPPGMSTITLTASSGSVTPQAIQLTLTVH
jgi:hypothetical protein